VVWRILWNRTVQNAAIAVVDGIHKWFWNVVGIELQPTCISNDFYQFLSLVTAMVMDGCVNPCHCDIRHSSSRFGAFVMGNRLGKGGGTRNAWLLKKGQKGCPETSVTKYQSTLRNIPEGLGCHLYRGGCWKSWRGDLECLTFEERTEGCPETSVTKYQSTLRNIPEGLESNLHRGGCFKSWTEILSWGDACNTTKNNSWLFDYPKRKKKISDLLILSLGHDKLLQWIIDVATRIKEM
jgi:hypothetical protein